jgi:hypothetical protein
MGSNGDDDPGRSIATETGGGTGGGNTGTVRGSHGSVAGHSRVSPGSIDCPAADVAAPSDDDGSAAGESDARRRTRASGSDPARARFIPRGGPSCISITIVLKTSNQPHPKFTTEKKNQKTKNQKPKKKISQQNQQQKSR